MKYSFYQELLDIKMEEFNPNPYKTTSDDIKSNDCTIRSYCKLLHKSWLDVFDDITELCKNTGLMYNCSKITELYLLDNGYIEYNIDEDIITVGEFMYKHKSGKYILMTKNHCVCYIDGIWYDNKANLKNPDGFLLDKILKVYREKI